VTLEQVLAAASGGPEKIVAFLDASGAEATPELARAARAEYLRAAERSDGEGALVAVLAACMLFRRLGMEGEALRNEIDFQALFYLNAEDPERYASLRSAFHDLARRADAASRPDLAFDAEIYAAESALHGMLAAQDDTMLTPTLEDTLLATRRIGGPVAPLSFERLVYLVAQLGGGTAQEPLDGTQTALVRELAQWVRERVPDDFAFTSDARIDAQIAGQLTELGRAF